VPNQHTEQRDIAERLFSRRVVAYNGCWLWEGVLTPKGYGLISLDGRMYTVHRLVAKLFLGADTDDQSVHIRHSCDCPGCFNPDHLEVGSCNDNVQDRFDRDKWGKIAKLTREDIDNIKIAYANGQSQRSIARAYGVAPSTISRAISGQRWSRNNRREVI
jgi:hypothetical protein